MPIEIPELKDYSPGSLENFFSEVLSRFDSDAAGAASAEAVEQLRIRWIGRKQGLLIRGGRSAQGRSRRDAPGGRQAV